MDALKHVKYPHCKSIRLWKTFCEDEGVRGICQFVEQSKTVVTLDLLDNLITSLGCEFISRTLQPSSFTNVEILKLDHNAFGSEGMKKLAEGLAIN